ncbi:hypothetical protein [Rhodococcus sp. 14-2483-1-2]|uniref:hypothetical protein n=1 Tax=Rhodococcus sp. 14-2483-1-2 TaxID=2023147 RepID=UPI0014830CE8|nr:hypothetical protein [Rhodococcus sp. 14-2483-1-2]
MRVNDQARSRDARTVGSMGSGGQDIASTPSSGSYGELMAVCERSRIDTIVPAA